MTLTEAIDSYVTVKRSLGAVFSGQEYLLRSFARAIGDVPLEAISSQACDAFCRGTGPATRFWENKHQALRGFFRYLVSRNQIAQSPLQEPGPRADRAFRPYIYPRRELQRLLDSTLTLKSVRFPLQPLTYRTLILVLYGAGLRVGEALRLRWCDVDLRQRLLSIWDTKFFKSRYVPMGSELSTALEKYRKQRAVLAKPCGACSAFFAARSGQAISRQSLETVFARLREHAEIRRPVTDRWQPRLHDLRHYVEFRTMSSKATRCWKHRDLTNIDSA